MKMVKVKSTGVITAVSDKYFDRYEKEGWFLEVIVQEPVVVKVQKPKEPKES